MVALKQRQRVSSLLHSIPICLDHYYAQHLVILNRLTSAAMRWDAEKKWRRRSVEKVWTWIFQRISSYKEYRRELITKPRPTAVDQRNHKNHDNRLWQSRQPANVLNFYTVASSSPRNTFVQLIFKLFPWSTILGGRKKEQILLHKPTTISRCLIIMQHWIPISVFRNTPSISPSLFCPFASQLNSKEDNLVKKRMLYTRRHTVSRNFPLLLPLWLCCEQAIHQSSFSAAEHRESQEEKKGIESSAWLPVVLVVLGVFFFFFVVFNDFRLIIRRKRLDCATGGNRITDSGM